jgi:hypothetical protein
MLTLVIALISCIGVIVASVLNHRAVSAAARITAADPVRCRRGARPGAHRHGGRALQHDTAVEVARIQATAAIEAARLAHGGHLPPWTT